MAIQPKLKAKLCRPFQEIDDGHFAVFEHGKEIIGGGFHQSFVSQPVKGGRLEHGCVTLAAAVLAACLQLLHDGLPGAFDKRGVTGRQIGAGQMQVQHRLAVRLVAGVDQLQRLVFVAGAQTFLLAGRRILGIIDSVAPEQCVFSVHVHGSESCTQFRRDTLRCSGRVSAG